MNNVPDYQRPEVIKRIYELRTQGESFRQIALIMLDEFELKITEPTIKNIYERFVAKNLLVNAVKEEKVAGEITNDYQKKMDERFNRVSKVTDELMDTIELLKKNMEPEIYVKYIPTILMVCREILNQLTFIKREQSQVLVNQKNLIYSPLQIMNIVNTEIIKLEKAGKIEIKDTTKSGRVLRNNEKKSLVFTTTKNEEEIEMEQRQKKKQKDDEVLEVAN